VEYFVPLPRSAKTGDAVAARARRERFQEFCMVNWSMVVTPAEGRDDSKRR
jgi:hypothetical protein